MQIKAFRLHHIGRFESLDASFTGKDGEIAKVVIFVGNNGSGKTSILKSLSTSLGWLVARIRTEKGNGPIIKEGTISNAADFAKIEIDVIDKIDAEKPSELFSWTVARPRTGRVSKENSSFAEVTELAAHYRNGLTQLENYNLPLVAFYPVERSVTDARLKSRNELSSPQLAGYEGLSDETTNFSRFFEWFRDREDHENELQAMLSKGEASVLKADEIVKYFTDQERVDPKKAKAYLKQLEENMLILAEALEKLPHLQERAKELPRDNQLNAVRTAIQNFMPGFTHLRVQRKPLQMLVEKDGQTLDILQLSQGEKSLMALVGDIARRLAMLNPSLEDPLLGEGVVLIDEVDMHLHPKWQRNVIQQLVSTFPNCQFILTTHSPLVISDSKNILTYSLDNGELKRVTPQYGQDVNSVLLGVMDTPVRNEHFDTQLGDTFDMIQSGKVDDARQMIAAIEDEILDPASNIELSKAKLMLRKQELRLEKNR